MRLIYFIPLLSTTGGLERTLIDKANYLVGKGHDVMFVTYEHVGHIAYTMSPLVMHLDLNCHFFSIYRHSIFSRFFFALIIKSVFRRKMKKILSHVRPDVIVVAIPNTENFICDVLSVAKDIPIVVESHLAKGYEVINRGIVEKFLYLFNNPLKAIRKAKLFISLTEGDADCWRKSKVQNIKVIPDPLAHVLGRYTEEKLKFRIICVGRLVPQKRFDRLVNAFYMIADKYPEWYICIFGEGENKGKLQKQINELGLTERVCLMSKTDNIYYEYQRSQFFVLSSDFEGFGLVITEAMACGIPVVATDCPFGPSEIIEDGKTGLLAKMDEKDLAEKIEWMITHEEERKRMGALAYEASAKYKKDLIIPQWEKAYMSVIK